MALFLSALTGVGVLFDYFGIMRVRDKLPRSFYSYSIVQKYVRYADMLNMSPEERLKTMRYMQIEDFNSQKEALNSLQHDINLRQQELSEMQKKMEAEQAMFEQKKKEFDEMKKELQDFEEKQKKEAEAVKQKEAADLLYQEQLVKLVKIYEKMEPENAGLALEGISNQLLSDLFDKMSEKRAAKIMNNMTPARISEFMSWKERQKK